eukprot:2247024-Prymnesium_polylepis.2
MAVTAAAEPGGREEAVKGGPRGPRRYPAQSSKGSEVESAGEESIRVSEVRPTDHPATHPTCSAPHSLDPHPENGLTGEGCTSLHGDGHRGTDSCQPFNRGTPRVGLCRPGGAPSSCTARAPVPGVTPCAQLGAVSLAPGNQSGSHPPVPP